MGQAPQFKTTPGSNTAVFNSAYTNYATDYFVQRKDGSGFITKSKIHVDDAGRQYLLYKEDGSKEEKRVYASETMKISYEERRKGIRVEGMAWDSCWLFKLVEGKITLYSNFPPPMDLANETVFAIKVEDGPIEIFSPEKLRLAVQGNKAATEALDKKFWQNNYLKAAQKFNKD
jgi:hypothetical protein